MAAVVARRRSHIGDFLPQRVVGKSPGTIHFVAVDGIVFHVQVLLRAVGRLDEGRGFPPGRGQAGSGIGPGAGG